MPEGKWLRQHHKRLKMGDLYLFVQNRKEQPPRPLGKGSLVWLYMGAHRLIVMCDEGRKTVPSHLAGSVIDNDPNVDLEVWLWQWGTD